MSRASCTVPYQLSKRVPPLTPKMRFSFIQFSPFLQARNSIYFAKFDELTAWWLDPIFTIMSKHLLHARFSHSIKRVPESIETILSGVRVRENSDKYSQGLEVKVVSEWKPIQRGTFLGPPVSCGAICKRTLQSNDWFCPSLELFCSIVSKPPGNCKLESRSLCANFSKKKSLTKM